MREVLLIILWMNTGTHYQENNFQHLSDSPAYRSRYHRIFNFNIVKLLQFFKSFFVLVRTRNTLLLGPGGKAVGPMR
jgi:hypothetical protein